MKRILPALAAVSGACGLAGTPAAALELGELMVESKLGQPLRASIAYALQADEQLGVFCIFLKPGVTAGGLQSVSKAQVSLGDNTIYLRGAIPIREPMLGLQLVVDCPYTAKLQRDYTMFLYPGGRLDDAVVSGTVTAPSVSETAPTETARSTGRSTPRRAVADAAPISGSNRYQVQPGDSLSSIVARIADRPRGLWPAVNVIFAANPEAFIGGDVNLIKSGSWLEIPDLYLALGAERTKSAAATAASTPSPAASTVDTYDGAAAEPAIPADVFDSGFAGTTSTTASTDATPIGSASTEPPDAIESAAPRPGDVILGNESPFVSPIESKPATTAGATTSPDIVADAALTDLPGAATAVSAITRGPTTGSWSLLAWLGGAGFAVFLGLLLFGRQVRERFGSSPVGVAANRGQRRRSSEPERRVAPPPDVDVEFDTFAGDKSSMLLDADLGLGTGLRDTSDIDVAQDFGFSTSNDLASEFDLDLTAAATRERDEHPTDVIPPHLNAEQSILESEIPPSDDDDEYDLSMIVDATRQPIGDTHLTAKDLKAVQVGPADEDDDDEEYTLSREVDYKILEQDYQEEFTTTQALNEEIARAALELAETLHRRLDDDDSLEATAEMPDQGVAPASATAASTKSPAQTEAEITAELTGNLLRRGEAVNDDLISDLDDTGVNEELTSELPQGDNDTTAEMAVEGGRIDTKKTRVS